MKKYIFALSTSLVLSNFNAQAEDFFDLSLEELMNIEITTASKREESAFKSAAATHVITNEDIRRSGATSIPEILRLAPGVQVARIDSDEWAVGIRGFNDRFSEKLLVLVDGRSAYVPLFSGVYWDSLNYILEDIERIEVIRGSGGAVWGANAVNGVINIITKNPEDTQGNYLSVAGGDFTKNITEIRHGDTTKSGNPYSFYAKSETRGEVNLASSNEGANDDWQMNRAGFKYKKNIDNNAFINFQGEAYSGNSQQIYDFPTLSTTNTIVDDTSIVGGNFIAKYHKDYSENSVIDSQIYSDYDSRDIVYLDRSNRTIGANAEHYYRYNPSNELVYGVEYRNITDNLREQDIDGTTYITFARPKLTYNVASLFFQNKTELTKDKLFLTLGSKFEYNDFTHGNIQPTARLSYFPHQDHHLWSAVSRAVRTPTRWEDGMTRIVQPVSASVDAEIIGNQQFDDETTISYEAGYKSRPFEKMSFDLAIFYNEYDNLRGALNNGSPTFDVTIDNSADGESYGGEIFMTYDVTKKLRTSIGYSFIKLETHISNDLDFSEFVENRAPQNQFHFRSYYNVSDRLQWDLLYYFTDNLTDKDQGVDVDAYQRIDSRISYKLDENSNISLIGENLNDSQHQEWEESLYSGIREIGRSFLVQFDHKF